MSTADHRPSLGSLSTFHRRFVNLLNMAKKDPTLISFRLDREVVRDIESRPDCPPQVGAGLVGGASLWVRQLVMRELGLDSESDTDQARERAVDEFLRAVTAYWRIRKVITDLQAVPDKKTRPWASKMARAERQLAETEGRLEPFPRTDGHELGCDCAECQQAAGTARL